MFMVVAIWLWRICPWITPRMLSLHDHQRRAGMAEVMEADARQTGGFGQAVKHVSERYHCQGLAIKGFLPDYYIPSQIRR